jgi:hypothetical protein
VDTFDFLREIVENVPDPTNGGVEEEGSEETKKRKRNKTKAEDI